MVCMNIHTWVCIFNIFIENNMYGANINATDLFSREKG
jgi:hypothetical protein